MTLLYRQSIEFKQSLTSNQRLGYRRKLRGAFQPPVDDYGVLAAILRRSLKWLQLKVRNVLTGVNGVFPAIDIQQALLHPGEITATIATLSLFFYPKIC